MGSQGQRTLVVFNWNWHSSSASSVTMRLLMAALPKESFTVLSRADSLQPIGKDNVFPILNRHKIKFSWTVDQYYTRAYSLSPVPISHAKKLFEERPFSSVLAVFPDLHAVTMGRRIAAALHLPFSLYMHDMMAATYQEGLWTNLARKLERQVFEDKKTNVIVLNDGMAEIYERNYGRRPKVVQHCYDASEHSAPKNPEGPEKIALFSGNVYGINLPAVVRAARAAIDADFKVRLTNKRSYQVLLDAGISEKDLSLAHAPSRSEYLNELQKATAFFSPLSWPDESSIHRDELSTIFPTKIIDYFASKRPILIHCPEEYYLSRFASKWNCAHTVSSKDHAKLVEAWNKLGADEAFRRNLVEKAQATLPYFDASQVARHFQSAVFPGDA